MPTPARPGGEMSFFGFGQSVEVEILLNDAESRKRAEHKTEDGKKEKYFLFYDGETVSGKVSLSLKNPNKRLEHQGIKIEFIGQIGESIPWDLPKPGTSVRPWNRVWDRLLAEIFSAQLLRGLRQVLFNCSLKREIHPRVPPVGDSPMNSLPSSVPKVTACCWGGGDSLDRVGSPLLYGRMLTWCLGIPIVSAVCFQLCF